MTNQPPHEELWERYRDGDLSDADRQAFEQYLQQDEQADAIYQAESQWLACLEHDLERDANLPDADRQTFTQNVLDRWQPVPKRSGQRRLVAAASWLAAAAVIALAIWVSPPGQPKAKPQHASADPVSVLVQRGVEQYGQQFQRFDTMLERTAAWISVNRFVTLLDLPVPDPAQFIGEPQPSRS